ncbi:hypothetical protein NAI64_09040, partial [Oxalobacter sp. OxGP1]|uniref:hypothetical protein n=1 Tax=Oxalobacter paeniformigenes TaxID=2946594 RepID=UPI0022AF71B6
MTSGGNSVVNNTSGNIITAGAGATNLIKGDTDIEGTLDVTGTTNINTTGTAATTIGSVDSGAGDVTLQSGGNSVVISEADGTQVTGDLGVSGNTDLGADLNVAGNTTMQG